MFNLIIFRNALFVHVFSVISSQILYYCIYVLDSYSVDNAQPIEKRLTKFASALHYVQSYKLFKIRNLLSLVVLR